MTSTCRNGHPRTPDNTYSDGQGRPRRCAVCDRARERARYDERHAGHNVIHINGVTMDGLPRRRCLTCFGPAPRPYTPPPADPVVVLRVVRGDPPPYLNVSERREAVLSLRGVLSTRLIAERVGLSPRTVWRHLAAGRTGAAA